MSQQRTAIYAGTFDPITLGHMDVVRRGLKLFDHLVIGVAENPKKCPMFNLESRLTMVQESLQDEGNITVTGFTGLLVQLAHQHHATALLRGLRAASDFEYEFQMASMNRHLDVQLESVFVMAREDYTFVSSSFIREISSMGGDISKLVPKPVLQRLGWKNGS